MYIILINGHVGCLKTTLSYLLASRLGFAHVSTSVMGHFTSNKSDPSFIALRNARYSKLKIIAETYLALGVSIVLDGNFPFKKLRKEIYDLGEKYNISDVISLQCKCSNIKELENRFNYRRENSNTPDSNANKIETYWSSVEEYEDIEHDEFNNNKISKVFFDSGTFIVEMQNSNDNMTKKLFDILQELLKSSFLKKPFF